MTKKEIDTTKNDSTDKYNHVSANFTKEQLADKVKDMISNDRNKTHGDAKAQFNCAQDLKELLKSYNKSGTNEVCQESLDMICTKLSRIAVGENRLDHWLDIAGYAIIAAEQSEY